MKAIVVIAIIYAIGIACMWLFVKNWKLAAFWPLTVLWMLLGNIQ